MSQQSMPALEAAGTIRPFRYVKMDTSNDNQGAEADANELCVGVADGSTRLHDSANHAEDGDHISLQPGVVHLVEAGGTIVRGARVKSDADGKAVTLATSGTTTQEVCGIAMESAASGEIVHILWQPQVLDYDASANQVLTSATDLVLTNADNGAIISCDTTANDVSVTLPAAEAGLRFTFIVTKIGATEDVEIQSPSATNYFHGSVMHMDTDVAGAASEVIVVNSDYNSNDFFTMITPLNGRVEMFCDGTLWYVSGWVGGVTAPTFGDATGL